MNSIKTLFFLFILGCYLPSLAQDADRKASIYFPFNSSVPELESLQNLQKLLSIAHFDTLKLTAHCDAIGSDHYNDSLSNKRKDAVIHWLIEQKLINTQTIKIISSAQGERKPLNSNATEEERRLNRRVELTWNKIRQVIEIPKKPVHDIQVDTVAQTEIKQPIESQTSSMAEQIEQAKETGKSLILKNINFVGGRAQFLPIAFPTLKELVKIMKENPELKIEIQGHVCCTMDGADGPNLETGGEELSVDRARAVYDYLIYNGIEKSRLRYKGFGGKKRLIYPEMSESDRVTNRRVEIVVLKD